MKKPWADIHRVKFQGKTLCLCQSTMPSQALSFKYHVHANDSKTHISHPDLVSELLTGIYSAALWNPFADGCLSLCPITPCPLDFQNPAAYTAPSSAPLLLPSAPQETAARATQAGFLANPRANLFCCGGCRPLRGTQTCTAQRHPLKPCCKLQSSLCSS